MPLGLDLNDSKVFESLRQQANNPRPGAGQVRPIGTLGFSAPYEAFHHKLEDAITQLAARWADLQARLRREKPETRNIRTPST